MNEILTVSNERTVVVAAYPQPENKRVGALLVQPMEDGIRQACAAAAQRDPQPATQWVALVDGHPTPWDWLRTVAEEYDVTLQSVLDLLPVLGYVWQVAWAFHQPETLEVEAWVSARLAPVWHGCSTPVAVGLRRRATAHRLPEAQRTPVEPWAHNLCLYPDCWHDDADLAASCSVATQGIEGACRPLVKERMAVTGAR